VALVAALMLLRGSSDNPPVADPEANGGAGLLQPGDQASENLATAPSADPSAGSSSLTGVFGGDPFANDTGDNTLHKVVVRFTSDGALYAGWRYRTKGGEGLKVAEQSLTVGKTVRGSLPVAQAAVQVLGTSTYATCSISVDGVTVRSQTARGQNHVVVCVG
jgi:hypothetical protein